MNIIKQMKSYGLTNSEIFWEVIGAASILVVPVLVLLLLEMYAK